MLHRGCGVELRERWERMDRQDYVDQSKVLLIAKCSKYTFRMTERERQLGTGFECACLNIKNDFIQDSPNHVTYHKVRKKIVFYLIM
jgi:hypothetical protein